MASGRRLTLEKYDPVDTLPFDTNEDARRLLNKRVRRLYDLTQLLFAQNRWSVLFIFQAMDGAGKDSAIKHVMRGLDPKATQVFSFKLPSTEELKHDFMWRCMKSLPERGRIGIFNRSYYEEVLVSRVHPELLEHQQLPKRCVSKHIWHDRFEDIRAHRTLPGAQRDGHPKDLSERLEDRAASPLSRTPERPVQEMEVLGQRRQRTAALEGIHGRLREGALLDEHPGRSVVRRPGRP